MKEELLHTIWKYKLTGTVDYIGTKQEKIKIISILKESENSESISTLIDLPKMVKFIEKYTFLSTSRELRDFIRCFGVALFLLQSKSINLVKK